MSPGPWSMKSRATSLSRCTGTNGPNGGPTAAPRMWARNSAHSCLSRTWTVGWFSWMATCGASRPARPLARPRSLHRRLGLQQLDVQLDLHDVAEHRRGHAGRDAELGAAQLAGGLEPGVAPAVGTDLQA